MTTPLLRLHTLAPAGKEMVQELPSAWDRPPVVEVVKLTEYSLRAPAASEMPSSLTDTALTSFWATVEKLSVEVTGVVSELVHACTV